MFRSIALRRGDQCGGGRGGWSGGGRRGGGLDTRGNTVGAGGGVSGGDRGRGREGDSDMMKV